MYMYITTYMYIYIYVRTHIYIHIHTYTHTYYTHLSIYIYTRKSLLVLVMRPLLGVLWEQSFGLTKLRYAAALTRLSLGSKIALI